MSAKGEILTVEVVFVLARAKHLAGPERAPSHWLEQPRACVQLLNPAQVHTVVPALEEEAERNSSGASPV